MTPRQKLDLAVVAAPFALSGVVHIVRPQVFESIIPAPLRGQARQLVVWSGVAELGCAALLAVPATRRVGGLLSAGLLAGVFPANIQMALDVNRSVKTSAAFKAGTIARLPVQVPLVVAAWRLWRRAA